MRAHPATVSEYGGDLVGGQQPVGHGLHLAQGVGLNLGAAALLHPRTALPGGGQQLEGPAPAFLYRIKKCYVSIGGPHLIGHILKCVGCRVRAFH